MEENETKKVRGNEKCLRIFNRKTSSQVTILEDLDVGVMIILKCIERTKLKIY